MKKNIFLVGVILFSCFAFSVSAAAAEAKHHPQRLLVKYKPSKTVGLAQSVSIQGVKRLRPVMSNTGGAKTNALWQTKMRLWQVAELDGTAKLDAVMAKLKAQADVEFVEYDSLYKITAIPDDTDFGNQWGLHNLGTTGSPDADIDAPEAWDVAQSTNEVVVAVIDSGVEYTHPDLVDNMWVNSREIAGNGIDDDNNGFVDDTRGYDFVDRDNDPSGTNNHGTHVAGIIAAKSNNARGIAGIAQLAKIMPLRALNTFGATSDIVDAIRYAVANGAQIINASWGGSTYSQLMHEAISSARAAGVIMVVAAGNASENVDVVPDYPLSYRLDNLIGVAASTNTDSLAVFSNYGKASVDLAAPGDNIYSTARNGSYIELSGTSMAAPFVTGAVAVIKSQFPDLSIRGVRALLRLSADRLPTFTERTISGGRLNLANALNCDPTVVRMDAAQLKNGFELPSKSAVTLSAFFHRCGSAITGLNVNVSISSEPQTITLFDDGLHGDEAANDGIYANTTRLLRTGASTIDIAADATNSVFSASYTGRVVTDYQYVVQDIPFAWENTNTSTASLSLSGDDNTANVLIPFSFGFYGNVYSNVTVSTNGLLSFGGTNARSFSNIAIPSSIDPNNIIAALWADLYVLLPNSVTSTVVGTAPNRKFVITWNSITPLGSTRSLTFQVVLHESGNIGMNYQTLSGETGSFASIGIENSTGTRGVQYGYRQPVLSDNKSILFSANAIIARPGGPYTGVRNQAVSMTGSAIGSVDPATLNYTWSFGDGASATGQSVGHVYQQRGIYNVTLIADDGVEFSLPAETKALIGPNADPIVEFPATFRGSTGQSISFSTTTLSDPDNDALTVLWDFGDGSTATGDTASHAYLSPGTYTVTVSVSDGFVTISRSSVVTIIRAPDVSIFDDNPFVAGSTTSIRAYVNTYGGATIANYRWSQIDGPPVTIRTPTAEATDIDVPATIPLTVEYAIGTRHSCAVQLDGKLYCWGDNSQKQISDSTVAQMRTPALIRTDKSWRLVSVGANHSCAATEGGLIECWGDNTFSQRGSNNWFSTHTARWLKLVSGSNHNCALRDDQTLWCWGDNRRGQLAKTGADSFAEPVQIKTNTVTRWKKVVAGAQHTCAIANDNDIYCWGANNYGQLTGSETQTVGNITQIDKPSGVAYWTKLFVGADHNCAISNTSRYFCWGRNVENQINISSVTNLRELVELPSYAFSGSELILGDTETCVLDYSIRCMGFIDIVSPSINNSYGTMISVGPFNSQITRMSARLSDNTLCAQNAELELVCIGDNSTGQLGDNSTIVNESNSYKTVSLPSSKIRLQITVTDSNGNQATTSNAFPTKSRPIAILPTGLVATLNKPFLLDGSFSIDRNWGSLEYEWRFQDSSPNTQQQLTKTFTQPGTQELTLTVWNATIGRQYSSTAVVPIYVNQLPVAANDVISLKEDTQTNRNLLANDFDTPDDELTIANIGASRLGVFQLAQGGGVTFTAIKEASGEDTVQYTVSDRHGQTSSAQVRIVVESVNDAPSANSLTFNMKEDESFDGELTASDIDSTNLSFAIENDARNGVVNLDSKTGKFSYRPKDNFAGVDVFRWYATDGDAKSNIVNALVFVENVNDAPKATDDLLVNYQNENISLKGVLLNDIDNDKDTLSIIEFGQPKHGRIAKNEDGLDVYIPELDYIGEDSFTYTVTDPSQARATGNVVVQIRGIPAKKAEVTPESDTGRGGFSFVAMLLFIPFLWRRWLGWDIARRKIKKRRELSVSLAV